ncbi:MAG: hypothetical protein JNG84_13975 [Archangium sp.]|nr:hypothetical protein [Archangium sp.]
MSTRDRRDFACIAAALLAWALLVAPLIHQLGHAHVHAHAAPALEHHQVALQTPVAPPEIHLVLVAMAAEPSATPHEPELSWIRRAEQPQGP